MDAAIRKQRFFSYPRELEYFVASALAAVVVLHLADLVHRHFVRHTHPSAARGISRLPAAVFGACRVVSRVTNLPELLFTAGYIAALFTWTFVNTTTTTGVHLEPHYWANRAATIAASQLPIMTALGMRNNPVAWLTGIGFDKLNALHRTSARTIVILGWVHGFGRILRIGLDDDETINHAWVRCGILAVSTLTVLCILTIKPVRRAHYELFSAIHFVLAALFLLAILVHLTGRTLTYYGAWPSMVLWGLDRAIRVVTLALYNNRTLDAQVDVIRSDFLKVTVLRPDLLHWRPGQSVFLSFPSLARLPSESHPFTIAATTDKTSLVFLIRVRNGLTRRLANSPLATQRVLLNGPYSNPPWIVGYHSAIFIAGGSGVAFTIPLLLDLVRRIQNGETTCTRILFIWAARHPEQVTAVKDLLLPALKDAPSCLSLEIKIHTTGNSSSNSSVDHASEKYVHRVAAMDYFNGRPELAAILRNEVDTAPRGSRMAVTVCGPESMTEATRSAIRFYPTPLAILNGAPSVTLHVEAFGGL